MRVGNSVKNFAGLATKAVCVVTDEIQIKILPEF
jgi:hypothetical protein